MRDRTCLLWLPAVARRRRSGDVLALAATLLALGSVAPAQAFISLNISTDTTIDSSATSLTADVVHVTGSAVLTIKAGGSISGTVIADDSSTINLEGGSIGGELTAGFSSTVNITGGSVAGLFAGSFHPVTVSGTCLKLVFVEEGGDTVNYRLTGTLQDGTPINVPAEIAPPSQIILNNAPLTLTPPAALTVPTDAGKCAATGVALGTATPGGACGTTTVTSDAPASFPLGSTTVTWKVLDDLGRSTTATQTVTVVDMELPTITCPPSKVMAADPGQCAASVPLDSPAAGDNCGTPTVSGSRSDGKNLGDPYPVGDTTITWSATDAAGNQATCTQTIFVTPTYAWSGLLPPINMDGTSVFKAGSTVPVTFTLSSACTGAASVLATLSWSPVIGGVPGPVNPAVSPGAANTGNQFRYDPTTGQYTFNWSTKGLSPGTYELQISLGSGAPYTVTVGLR